MILVCFIHSQPPERDSQDLNYSVCAYYSKSPDENQWQQILSPFPSSCPLKTDDFSDDALFFYAIISSARFCPKQLDPIIAGRQLDPIIAVRQTERKSFLCLHGSFSPCCQRFPLHWFPSSARSDLRGSTAAPRLLSVPSSWRFSSSASWLRRDIRQASAPSLPTARRSSSSRSAASQARRRGSFTSWR